MGTELQVQKSIVKSKESILTIISLQDRAKSLLETKKNQIKFYIEDWRKLELKDRNNIEVKNVLYKDLRNLVTFPQI